MLAKAITTLVHLGQNQTYQIEGRTYSDKELHLIEKPRYAPEEKAVRGLDGFVQMLRHEWERQDRLPIFVNVESYNEVSAYTTYDDRYQRQRLYRAVSDTPVLQFQWLEYEAAMIALRSQFQQTEAIAYVIDLLSRISDENSVKSEDNGLSQSVEIRKGIALKQTAPIQPIVKLIPYRTFLEIEQPESEFLLRLQEGGRVGLFEADGGMWKLESKRRIAAYLTEHMYDMIQDGVVVVTI